MILTNNYRLLKLLLLNSTFLFTTLLFSQNNSDSIKYLITFSQLSNILDHNDSFKKAIIITEKVYKTDSVPFFEYESEINFLTNLAKQIRQNSYHFRDSASYSLNQSIYTIISDTVYFSIDSTPVGHPPFRFNFTDPLGKKDITNTFVSKLLTTHQGNCKSLTYLYKILADELGAKCWIALAPGHMFIRNYSQKIGWYNTELTSGTFPTDAYIMASSYINPTAVMSGMYMDTLSNQQAIALCVLDLAHLYERQTKNYYDGFILKCCDLVLKYHPVNPMALLLKAETLKKQAIREKSSKYPRITYTLKEMEQTYLKLFDLGYREMPYKMKKQKQKEDKENAAKYGDKSTEKINKK